MSLHTLMIHEIFRSIQGESTYAGCPCVFVRLCGCNLNCRYCDTPAARQGGTPWRIPAIIDRVNDLGPGIVEVTGGEPLMQQHTPELLEQLARNGRTVLLETNGSLPLPAPAARPFSVIMDIKCPSSNASESMYWENLNRLRKGDEIKFVIANRNDFDWALAILRRKAGQLQDIQRLCMPVYGELAPAQIAEWLLESGEDLRLSIQLHKLLGFL